MGSKPAKSTDRRDSAAVIHAQRLQLFKASAIVTMSRHSCASLYERWYDPDRLADALRAADDLIDSTATALQPFAGNPATRKRGDDMPDPRSVVNSLRTDAALLLQQHPKLHTVHAQLLRAANVIEAMEGKFND
jgi:hypothetical protein